MIEIQQIADCPGRTPSGSSFQRLNHRLSRWLADRAEGVVRAPISNTVRWIPKSPEEQEAWRQRKARRSSSAEEKPARQYPYRRSAAQAYRQQRGAPEPIRQALAATEQVTSEPQPVQREALEGNAETGTAPVRVARTRHSSRRRAGSRPGKAAPRRRPDRVVLKPDFSNLDRVILHSIRVLR